MTRFAWLGTSALRLTGGDAITFLHGQVSNDVCNLSIPGSTHALVLNARGQIEFDVRIYRREHDLYLQAGPELNAALLERLKRYIVFDEVQLEDLSDTLCVLHIWGADALDVVESLGFNPKLGTVQQTENSSGTMLITALKRTRTSGFDVHLLSKNAKAFTEHLKEKFNLRSYESVDLERERVLAGLSDAHLDRWIGFLPQECGLESAVSYRKGCYIGQEIMARLEARGQTHRGLARVTSEFPLETGATIVHEKREIGQLGHGVRFEEGFTALAVVRKEVLANNTRIEITIKQGIKKDIPVVLSTVQGML